MHLDVTFTHTLYFIYRPVMGCSYDDNTSQQDFGTRKVYCVFTLNPNMQSKFFHHPQLLYNGLFNY